MQHLQPGQYFGEHHGLLRLAGGLVTDTEYTHARVDWHYHENAYFTFVLEGQLLEASRQARLLCTPGTLLFHHWQEPHYNVRETAQARGMHLELEPAWFERHQLEAGALAGSYHLTHPRLPALFRAIHRELHLADAASRLTIEGLLLQVFGQLLRGQGRPERGVPAWVARVRALLHEEPSATLTLERLAAEAGVHPVHLSREFARYFAASFGDYVRQQKVEQAKRLLRRPELPLADIAYQCGFADQSHFGRCFRQLTGLTPGQFRRRG